MIRYRYINLDPEPGPHVTRVGVEEWRRTRWDAATERWTYGRWDWSDRWIRVPCAGRGHGTVFGAQNRRKEARFIIRNGWELTARDRRNLRRSHRVGALCHPEEVDKYPDYPGWTGHYHWWNHDKMRHWASLRGATLRFDLDAYKRMHSMYPRRWKKRKR